MKPGGGMHAAAARSSKSLGDSENNANQKGMSDNNVAELEIRDVVVLHRNVCHRLSKHEGQKIFSMLISVACICHKQGIFPRIAVEELIMESGLEHIQTPWTDAKRDYRESSRRIAWKTHQDHVFGEPECIQKWHVNTYEYEKTIDDYYYYYNENAKKYKIRL